MITIPQRYGQTDIGLRTDRQTDRRLAVAIGEIAYQRCRLKTEDLKRWPAITLAGPDCMSL